MITVLFRCGHGAAVPENEQAAPTCLICGERRIVDVKAPKPRFTGHASGPSVTTKDLGPATVRLGTPLTLRGERHDG